MLLFYMISVAYLDDRRQFDLPRQALLL